jgi:esterase/lipase superfamily enzyme
LTLPDSLTEAHSRRSFRLVVLALAMCCGACASRPENVFTAQPNVAVPGASHVEVLVATTRRPVPVRGELFGGDRGELTFADIKISIPPDSGRKVGAVEWPARIPANPATEFTTLSADVLSKIEARKVFHQRVTANPTHKVLIFVHGYNNRFDDAVYRLAQIAHDSRTYAVPVLFTWPSRGKLLAYTYDHESASYSRDALETLLTSFVNDPSVSDVAVLAHSMGNWVTLETLRQMAIRHGRVPPKISNVMLASPDVDVDVFRSELASMGKNRPRLTLFVSRDDQALAVSRWVWGSSDRLGAVDPQSNPYRQFFRDERINVVDLTRIKTDDSLKHGKFAESPGVVQLIGRDLAKGQPITDEHLSLGDRLGAFTRGTAAAAGAAVGTVATLPVAAIDPDSRASVSDDIQEIERDAGSAVEP